MAFFASFRTNATLGTVGQAMWMHGRDGNLYRIIHDQSRITLFGGAPGTTNPPVSVLGNFGYSALKNPFNDLGMFLFSITRTNGAVVLVRAVPEFGGSVPCCEGQRGFGQADGQADGPNGPLRSFADPAVCDLFTFTGFTDTNWHRANWNDGRGQPHCDPPGDAAPNTARVVIPPLSDVMLDQRAAPIGSLDSGGHLTLRERLTISKTATATDLVVEGPSGGVTLANGAQMIVDSTIWKRGTLSMADGQIPALFASLDFLAESGAIEAPSGRPVFESLGSFRKDSPGEFVIRVPFNAIKPSVGTTRTEALAGILRLIGGGTFESDPVFHAAVEGTIELSGAYRLLGAGVLFDGNGIVDLGSPERSFVFEGVPRSYATFRVLNKAASFHRGELRGEGAFVNEGNFVWTGGTISLLVDRFFDNKGTLLIEPGVQERKLRGKFRHLSGTLRQGADVDLSEGGAILSQAVWEAVGPFRIVGSDGLVTLERTNFSFDEPSKSKLKVKNGLVEVETVFENQDGEVLVDNGATLRLKNVRNIQGTQLTKGSWEIGSGGLLETPGVEIEHVAIGSRSRGYPNPPTRVIYGGRGWPQFRPNKNEGHIQVATNLLLRTLVNDGEILVSPMGHLEIQEDFVVLYQSNDYDDSFSCLGRLTVGKDLVSSSEIYASGGAIVNVEGRLLIKSERFRISESSELNIKGDISNGGHIELQDRSILRTQGDFLNDPGLDDTRAALLQLGDGAEAKVSGFFLNRRYVLVGEDSTLTILGSMVNNLDPHLAGKFGGGMQVENGKVFVQGDMSLESTATSLIIKKFGSVTVGGLLRSAGAVRLEQGSIQVGAMRFTDQASLDGNGVLIGNVSVYGLASPGQSPGTLSVVGNFDQTNTSVLVIELAGTATNQFDRLLVSQNAFIGGTLAINLLDGFRPAPNDTFIVLDAGRLTNQFANATNGQRIATFGGFGSFQVNYTPTNVVLSAFELNPAPTTTSSARLDAPTLRLDSLELNLTGTPGREYLIETSTNLVTWSQTKTNVTGFDGQSLIELPASADSHRFFRARAK